MERWMLVAVVAAVTALASFLPSSGLLSGSTDAAVAEVRPLRVGHPALPDRPVQREARASAGDRSTASSAPALPAADDRAGADRADRAGSRSGKRSDKRSGRAHRRQAGKHAGGHARRNAGEHDRKRAGQHARHRARQSTRHHTRHDRHRHARAASARTAVPPRRIIGIRRALGVRPGMGPLGTDISWPQCPRGLGGPLPGAGLPMPLAAARFVVVGLTDGPAFHPNPCLERQVRWVKRHHLHSAAYAVASYPNRAELHRHGRSGPFSPRTLAGRLRNVGHRQARLNLATMRRAGFASKIIWIDVEVSNSRPWARRTALNAAVVRGVVHGYRSAGHRVGFYSTALVWRQIVGELRFGAPEWRTAGASSPRAALDRCRERDASIQGGPAVIGQWWNQRRDHDLLCPGHRTPERMRALFTRY